MPEGACMLVCCCMCQLLKLSVVEGPVHFCWPPLSAASHLRLAARTNPLVQELALEAQHDNSGPR